MTREEAICEIKNLAVDLDLKFEEAIIESLYEFYDAAGVTEEQLAEIEKMNTDQLIDAFISMYS